MARQSETATFVITGVCCAMEEAVLRKRLDAGIGRERYSYNPVTCELRVPQNVPSDAVFAGVREAGFGIRERHAHTPPEPFLNRHRQALQTAAAAAAALAGAGVLEAGAPAAGKALLAGAILIGGWGVFRKALRTLRQRMLDMNVLMTLAVIGALAIGKWEEGAAVIVLFSVSLMLESYSTVRTRRAVESLMRLSPEEAVLLTGDGEETVAASTVRPGQRILIRPGMRIPLDGIVRDGVSSVSEAMLTGETIPVEKQPGMEVYAGCMNGRGALAVEVSRRFEETRLAHIIQLVEEAQHQRAPLQSSTERFAGVYTWVVVAGAVLVAAVPPLLPGQAAAVWLYRALVMLVIACPCALVISTPVTIVSALTAAARAGILIKGGKHLETLARVRAVAFDKTGTLTEGRLRVTDVICLNSLPPGRLLRVFAALEQRSEHPLAAAVLSAAEAASIDYRTLRIDRFEALPGQGLRALIDGDEYFLGNRTLAGQHGFASPEAIAALGKLEQEGKATLLLGKEGEALGILGLRDSTRREGARVVRELHDAGISHVVMLSGDSGTAVDRLGAELGLDRQSGALLPADKVKAVQTLRRTYGEVAMVGDGMNDTPALAASSVGIAMGASGTDAALESADVVLMADNLGLLPPLLRHSRKAVGIIRQNIAFALGIKLAFLLLSVAGISTLWMAVLADDGAALLVILNGMRALQALRPASRTPESDSGAPIC